MSTSLYCACRNKIEVGKYGMPIVEAKKVFLNICHELGLVPKKINEKPEKIIFDFGYGNEEHNEKLRKLLYKVAIVEDLHADAPWVYILESETIENGTYVKTGSFYD